MPHSFIAPEGEIPQQNADKNAADIEDEINEEAGKTTKKTKRSREFLMRFWTDFVAAVMKSVTVQNEAYPHNYVLGL